MSSKRLQRVGIRTELIERFNRHGINCCGDVLDKSLLELLKLCGSSGLTVEDVILKCSAAVVPKPVTALELLQERKKSENVFASSIKDLDGVLHGGFHPGTITEITGPAGCGKTQFCMTLSMLAALPKEHGRCGVIYIDTEGAFSAKRLVEIAQCRLLQDCNSGISLNELANNVHVSHVQSCQQLMSRLENLEEDLITKNVSLIILDSVASLVRRDFGPSSEDMVQRTDFLATGAAKLKYFADTFSIPVIITNQITTHVSSTSAQSGTSDGLDETSLSASEAADSEGFGSYMTAALGNTWSHSVNTRLILQFLAGDKRQILVAKSPVAPFTCFGFQITKAGVIQSDSGQGHYTGTDPGSQVIQGRVGLKVQAHHWS